MSLQDEVSHLLPRWLLSLSAEERARCVVYAAGPKALAPENLPEALAPLAAEQRLAFVDLQPGANWMHRALWLVGTVKDSSDEPVRRVETDRPPCFGPLPPGWRVIWQSPGIASWQCLALADAPSAS